MYILVPELCKNWLSETPPFLNFHKLRIISLIGVEFSYYIGEYCRTQQIHEKGSRRSVGEKGEAVKGY